MKFANPYFKTPAEQKIALHQTAVNSWLQAQSANRVITLAELRAGLPAIAADLTRQVVNGICQNLGAHIFDPEDNQG